MARHRLPDPRCLEKSPSRPAVFFFGLGVKDGRLSLVFWFVAVAPKITNFALPSAPKTVPSGVAGEVWHAGSLRFREKAFFFFRVLSNLVRRRGDYHFVEGEYLPGHVWSQYPLRRLGTVIFLFGRVFHLSLLFHV